MTQLLLYSSHTALLMAASDSFTTSSEPRRISNKSKVVFPTRGPRFYSRRSSDFQIGRAHV